MQLIEHLEIKVRGYVHNFPVVFARASGAELSFMVPLTTTQDEFDEGFDRFKQAYKSVFPTADNATQSLKSA